MAPGAGNQSETLVEQFARQAQQEIEDAHAKALQEVAPGLERDERYLAGTEKFTKEAPPSLMDLDAASIKQKIQKNFMEIYQSPVSGLPTPPGTQPPLSIPDIASQDPTAPPPPYTNTQISKANEVDKTLRTTGSPVEAHVTATAKIFADLEQNIQDKFSATDLATTSLTERMGMLKTLYNSSLNQLTKQYETDRANFDKWFDNNHSKLADIYPTQVVKDNAESQAKLKEAMKKKMEDQFLAEVKFLDTLRQEAIISCNNNVEKRQIIEGNYLGKNSAKYNPDGALSMTGEHKFKDENRYDRYGNHFTVNKNGTITLNLRGHKYSDIQKANMIYERALALKQDGNDTIEINVRARQTTSNIFAPAVYTDKPPYTDHLSKMAWREAVRAGFEASPDPTKNKVRVAGYVPDDDDWRYYRQLKGYNSYGEFKDTLPTLHSLLEKTLFNSLYHTGKQRQDIDPNKVPELNKEERDKLLKADWFSVTDEQKLRDLLDGVRPGLGNAITLTGTDAEKAATIRGLRADMIKDPFISKLFREAVTPDLTFLLDELSKEQITKLNTMNFSQYKNDTDPTEGLRAVVRAINSDVLGMATTSKTGRTLDISECTFGIGGHKLTHAIAKFYLSPKKLEKNREQMQEKFLTSTQTYELKDQLKQHHIAISGKPEDRNSGLIERIDAKLAEVFLHASRAGTTDTFQFNRADQSTRRTQIALDYNELIYHASGQISALEQFCDKLASKNSFDHEDVRKEYKAHLENYLNDINAAIDSLHNAGKIKDQDGNVVSTVEFDPGSLEPELGKRGGSMALFQKEAERLTKERDRVLLHIADKTDFKINKTGLTAAQIADKRQQNQAAMTVRTPAGPGHRP